MAHMPALAGTCPPAADSPQHTLPHAPAEPKSDSKPAAKGKAAAAVKKVSSWGTGWRPGSQPLQCRLGRALWHRLALQPRLARACHAPNCLACCLTPPRTQEPALGEKPAAKKAAPKKAAAREDKPAAAKKPAAKERKPAAGSSAADAKVRAVPALHVDGAAGQCWRVPLCLLAALPPAVQRCGALSRQACSMRRRAPLLAAAGWLPLAAVLKFSPCLPLSCPPCCAAQEGVRPARPDTRCAQ